MDAARTPAAGRDLLNAFAERFGGRQGEPLPAALIAIAARLHALVLELRPSREDWRAAISLLRDIGHYSDERRDEWLLLSDLFGVTALVEEINGRRPKAATPNTMRGPFFRADAPARPLGANISLDGKGEPLTVGGRVADLDGEPVAGAKILTWQANAEGFYENQQPDLQPEFNLRGLFTADEAGRFHYRTVMPAGYPVPLDGPGGQLLKKAGFPPRRPAHLHFVVTAPGFETITTHVYDKDDPHLSSDPLFGVKPDLIKPFRAADSRGGSKNGRALDVTFVMARARQEAGR